MGKVIMDGKRAVLGHVDGGAAVGYRPIAMECVGFIVTFQRGCEWAATGKVTQTIPQDFPTESETVIRENCKPSPAN